MKRLLLLFCGLPVCFLQAEMAPGSSKEQEQLANRIAAFVENAGNAKETPPPKSADASPQEIFALAQRKEISQRFTLQLKRIQSAILRGDFNEAREGMENLEQLGAAGAVPEDWNNFALELATQLARLSDTAQERWYEAVEGLARDTRETCMSASDSGKLDPLLVRAAALQLGRPRQSDALSRRGNDKLEGIIATLQDYARYLDQKNAGNAMAANEILTRFGERSDFPVLSADFVRSKFLNVARELPREERARTILEQIGGPKDLPKAIKELEALQKDPTVLQQRDPYVFAKGEIEKLRALEKGWAALDAGKSAEALQYAGEVWSSGGSSGLHACFIPLTNNLIHAVILREIRKIPGVDLKEDAPTEVLLDIGLRQLRKTGNFQKLKEMLTLSQQITTGAPSIPKSSPLQQAQEPIEDFLAAQRFEAAGDPLMAIVKYREVLDFPEGQYVPHAEAKEALERLRGEHPEFFLNYEGVVLQELRRLSGMGEMVRRMSKRAPY